MTELNKKGAIEWLKSHATNIVLIISVLRLTYYVSIDGYKFGVGWVQMQTESTETNFYTKETYKLIKDNNHRLIVLQSSIDLSNNRRQDSLEYYHDKDFYNDERYYQKLRKIK